MSTLRREVFEAHRRIDIAAGEARLKYITDVPGQQAVYMAKLQQARDYRVAHALNTAVPVPPYIAGEAARMQVSAIVAAEAVDAIGTYWNDVLSPQMEYARLSGKDAVSTAAAASSTSDAEKRAAIAAAEAAARAALDAL